jgi:hypothetical protein
VAAPLCTTSSWGTRQRIAALLPLPPYSAPGEGGPKQRQKTSIESCRNTRPAAREGPVSMASSVLHAHTCVRFQHQQQKHEALPNHLQHAAPPHAPAVCSSFEQVPWHSACWCPSTLALPTHWVQSTPCLPRCSPPASHGWLLPRQDNRGAADAMPAAMFALGGTWLAQQACSIRSAYHPDVDANPIATSTTTDMALKGSKPATLHSTNWTTAAGSTAGNCTSCLWHTRLLHASAWLGANPPAGACNQLLGWPAVIAATKQRKQVGRDRRRTHTKLSLLARQQDRLVL